MTRDKGKAPKAAIEVQVDGTQMERAVCNKAQKHTLSKE